MAVGILKGLGKILLLLLVVVVVVVVEVVSSHCGVCAPQETALTGTD